MDKFFDAMEQWVDARIAYAKGIEGGEVSSYTLERLTETSVNAKDALDTFVTERVVLVAGLDLVRRK